MTAIGEIIDTNKINMTEGNEINYPSIKQSWGIVGIVLLSMILLSPINIFLNNVLSKEISSLVYYLFSMGAAFWIIHQIRKNRTGVSEYNFDFSSDKIMLLVSIAIIAIQTGISSPIIELLPMPDFVKNIFLEFANQNGVYSFITIVIAAPIFEELIFRGIILNGLLKKYSPLKSILISSILFGVIHLNPWQFISALILGMFSGWVYYKTKKLTLSILIHAVNNSIGFMAMYFMDARIMMDRSSAEFYGGYLNLFLVVVGAIMIALICIYLLMLEFKKIDNKNGDKQEAIL